MNNQPSEYEQPKGYQLDEIWQKVLRHCHGFYQVLLRDYGELLTFEETSACIRLCLFTGSWKLRLNKSLLTYSVTNAFSIAFSLSFNQSLSQEFKVYIEFEEIADQRSPFQHHPLKLDQLLSFPLPSVPLYPSSVTLRKILQFLNSVTVAWKAIAQLFLNSNSTRTPNYKTCNTNTSIN